MNRLHTHTHTERERERERDAHTVSTVVGTWREEHPELEALQHSVPCRGAQGVDVHRGAAALRTHQKPPAGCSRSAAGVSPWELRFWCMTGDECWCAHYILGNTFICAAQQFDTSVSWSTQCVFNWTVWLNTSLALPCSTVPCYAPQHYLQQHLCSYL